MEGVPTCLTSTGSKTAGAVACTGKIARVRAAWPWLTVDSKKMEPGFRKIHTFLWFGVGGPHAPTFWLELHKKLASKISLWDRSCRWCHPACLLPAAEGPTAVPRPRLCKSPPAIVGCAGSVRSRHVIIRPKPGTGSKKLIDNFLQ